MGETLFIGHRIPFPPDRGDKIRSHHFLKHLAKQGPVHVATFADDEDDLRFEVELAAISASYCLKRRSVPLVWAGLRALFAHQPISLTAFWDADLANYIAELIKHRPISTIYVFSGQMGQYIPEEFDGRIVLDFVDVDSAKFGQYAQSKIGPMSWVYKREERLLRAEEAHLAQRADVNVLVSEMETDLFRSRLSMPLMSSLDIRAIGNGIDCDAFDPDAVLPEQVMLECSGPRLIFTGQMDYAPNIDAALRVIERILPSIQQQLPSVTFHVVGRNPTSQLIAHNGVNGCYVWGRVPDIQPWLKAADIALVPLEIARGVQNKVLEAMAMKLPVVMSDGAAIGIGGQPDEHYAVATSDDELSAKVVTLLRDEQASKKMGACARNFVMENVAWPSVYKALAEALSSENSQYHSTQAGDA